LHSRISSIHNPLKNKEFAQSVSRTFSAKNYRIDILEKGIEFIPLAGQILPDFVSFSDSENGFKEQVINTLRKREFQKIKECI